MQTGKFRMKKLPGFMGEAKKMSGDGVIAYCLWVDDQGALYVQFKDNTIKTPSPGSFTGLLYPVAEYAKQRYSDKAITSPRGYDMETETRRFGEGSNNPGFLKAVLRDLLPEPE
jgi:hypothetical protein